MTRAWGTKWRVLAWRKDGSKVDVQNDGQFDELVLEDVLHLEQMDNRNWWMRLGDAAIYIRVPAKGKPKIIIGFGDQAHPGNETDWEIRGLVEQENARLRAQLGET